MKKLVLNDITLSQIKYNAMKVDPNSLKQYEYLDSETVINTYPLIIEDSLLSIIEF